jgi:predicted RNA-binding Zn ribbon-like protein
MYETRVLAPQPLALVQDFVNTAVRLYAEEHLPDGSALTRWLAERDLLPASADAASEEELRSALRLREALRTLYLPREAGLDPEAVDEINRVAGRARLTPRLHPDGTVTLEPAAHDTLGALGALAAVAVRSFADGTGRRLKTCAAPDCRWVFFDRSRNSSGTWCNPALCGTRMRMRAYRSRHHSPTAEPPDGGSAGDA